MEKKKPSFLRANNLESMAAILTQFAEGQTVIGRFPKLFLPLQSLKFYYKTNFSQSLLLKSIKIRLF